MPNWTTNDLRAYQDRRAPKGAELELPVRHESVGKIAREASHPARFRVCVTARRTQLLDPDNLCPKYFVDCCRYAGLIPNDTLADIELVPRQEKVAHRSEEETIIEVIPL